MLRKLGLAMAAIDVKLHGHEIIDLKLEPPSICYFEQPKKEEEPMQFKQKHFLINNKKQTIMQPTKEINDRSADEVTRLIEEERRRENFKQFTRAKLHKGKNQRKIRKKARLVRGN